MKDRNEAVDVLLLLQFIVLVNRLVSHRDGHVTRVSKELLNRRLNWNGSMIGLGRYGFVGAEH
jgi:hypothetical protein